MTILSLSPDGTVGQAVADYAGGTVTDLEVVPDPQVYGCFAIRAVIKRDPLTTFTVDFLVKNVKLNEVTATDLEEVSFTSWPPGSRG